MCRITCRKRLRKKLIGYFSFDKKVIISLIIFDTSMFWGSNSSSRDIICHKTICHTSNVKKSDFKDEKYHVFWIPLLLLIYFFRTSHKFCGKPPHAVYKYPWLLLGANLVLLLFPSAITLSRGEGPDMFL